MSSRPAGASPDGFGMETEVAPALGASCVGWSAVVSTSGTASSVPLTGAPGWPFGCASAGEPAASGDVLGGRGALDGDPGPCGAGLADVVGADGAVAVGVGVGVGVGAMDVGSGVGVAVAVGEEELEGAGVASGEAVERPPGPPRRPCSRPLTLSTSPSAATLADAVGSVLPLAAWDAVTPADRTSTAPTAAAEAPRRSPPWILVRERENLDL